MKSNCLVIHRHVAIELTVSLEPELYLRFDQQSLSRMTKALLKFGGEAK